MSCESCDKKKHTGHSHGCPQMTPAVIKIENPEGLTLFHKVMIPASMGDESQTPPTIGKYCNVLMEYEVNGNAYLYSSDGIPTKLTPDQARDFNNLVNRPKYGGVEMTGDTNIPDVTVDIAGLQSAVDNIEVEMTNETAAREAGDLANANAIASEATAREQADSSLSSDIGSLSSSLSSETAAREAADQELDQKIDNEISNREIAVAGVISDLGDEAAVRAAADETLQGNIDGVSSALSSETTARQNADAALQTSIDAIDNAIDKVVMVDLSLGSNPSTTTIELDANKENIKTGAASTKNIPLPVASSTQAGVMNSATFNAVAQNTEDIEAIMNGAVAIDNLAAGVTQAQITSAWKSTTGQTDLINHASVYDIANNRVWTYYSNTSTWYATTNTSQVTIDRFTNTSEGTIKGSTNVGQVFAESDGTGSVNGWDALSSAVDANTSKLATIAQGAEVNQNAFSNIKVGSTTVAADSKTDTLELVAGDNITLTPDATNDKVTIAGKNMVYTKNNLSPAADTTTAWISLFGDKTATGVDVTSGYFVTWYTTSGKFDNQPSSYGFLETFTNGTGDIYQRWHTQASGPILYRSGNRNGWKDTNGRATTGTWDTVATGDKVNYAYFYTSTSQPIYKRVVVTGVDAAYGGVGVTIFGRQQIFMVETTTSKVSSGTAYLGTLYEIGTNYNGEAVDSGKRNIHIKMEHTSGESAGTPISTTFYIAIDAYGFCDIHSSGNITVYDSDATEWENAPATTSVPIARLSDIPTLDTALSATSEKGVTNQAITNSVNTLLQTSADIPEGADLNTAEYLRVGNYRASNTNLARTLVNCPTQTAFMMKVYNVTSGSTGNEETAPWVYRIRTIVDIQGNVWVQKATSGGTPGNFTYGEWKKVATTDDLPTVNNATLTIQKNGTTVQTFTANSATDTTANITVPTTLSELSNDSGYVKITMTNTDPGEGQPLAENNFIAVY